jgi:hypothetical protein
VQSLLDQELNGLPENYRLPIVLCDLEGKAIKEATRQLGWPQGTVAGRLARGRKLLAKRLANRGVALTAGTLAAVMFQNAAPSRCQLRWSVPTAEAAARIAAGQATIVPNTVAILAEGALRAMFLNKLRTATTLGLLLVALLIGAATIDRTWAAEQPRVEQKNGSAPDVAGPAQPAPPLATGKYEYDSSQG